jgi:HEAT repeat protein
VQVMRVRSMAALALGDIGRRAALGPVQRAMEGDDDPRVQLAAATAILKILNDRLTGTRPAAVASRPMP